MDLQKLTSRLRSSEAISPTELAELKLQLAGEYAWLSSCLDQVLRLKAGQWETFRAECTSDTQAERKWQNTPNGSVETSYRLQLKSIEKIMSAMTTRIRIYEGEARAQF